MKNKNQIILLFSIITLTSFIFVLFPSSTNQQSSTLNYPNFPCMKAFEKGDLLRCDKYVISNRQSDNFHLDARILFWDRTGKGEFVVLCCFFLLFLVLFLQFFI